MANEKTTEKPIVNIVRAELVTEETTPRTFRFNTATEATYAAVISEGTETVLRVKNEIKSINRTEDIQYGSDINMSEAVMTPEVMAIVDGGTLTKDEGGKITKYTPPVMGAPVNRVPFTLKLYTEEKDTSGDTVGYQCFSFKGCKGKPVSYTFKDGEYLVPQYTAKSRVKKGTAPYELDFMDELPA